MSDDAFRELLRSPLDDPPDRGAGDTRLWQIGMGAAVAGTALTLALAWAFGGFDEGEAAPTPTVAAPIVTASDTTTAPDPVAPAVTLEPQWVFEADGVIYVTVASIAPAGGTGEAPGIVSANWAVELADGRRLAATAEVVSSEAPGLFTIAIPAPGVDAADVTRLLANPLVGTREVTGTAELGGVELPLVLPPPDPELRSGGSLAVIDEAVLHDAGGEVTWHLEGPEEERAELEIAADYVPAGADEPEAIRADFQIPGVALQLAAHPPEPARSGLIELFHLDDPESPTFRTRFWGDPDDVVPLESLSVGWRLVVYEYGTESVAVALGEATRLP